MLHRHHPFNLMPVRPIQRFLTIALSYLHYQAEPRPQLFQIAAVPRLFLSPSTLHRL